MVRSGHAAAYGVLYTRHSSLALRVAQKEADNSSDAEDIVSDAFAVIFQALGNGGGPKQSFGAYLLTTVRRMAHRRNLQARRGAPPSHYVHPIEEAAKNSAGLGTEEAAVLITALRSLPSRWQAVLWYTEVDDMKPAEISKVMGLTANAVSALLLRAREGLRIAYIQSHVIPAMDNSCEAVMQKLGRFVLSSGSMPGREAIRRHVNGCPNCTVSLAALGGMREAMIGNKRPG
ncbi:sigma-70 family RNA polymerase sigma factor [Paenarthrobacter sp. NPDC089307]